MRKYCLKQQKKIQLKTFEQYERESNQVEENKILQNLMIRLQYEYNELANELLITCNSKTKLLSDLETVKNKVNHLNKELLLTKSLLSEAVDEKNRLEDEVKCLKDIFRREIEMADNKIAQKNQIKSFNE